MKENKYVMFITKEGITCVSNADIIGSLKDVIFKLYFKGQETDENIKYKVENEINIGDVYAQYQSETRENVRVLEILI